MASSVGGKVVWEFDAKTNSFNRKLDQASSNVKNFGKSTTSTANTSNKSWLKQGAVIGAVAGVVQSVATRAFDSLARSMDGAIKRVDIMANFPNVMGNLGIGAKDSRKAINRLSEELTGLPTKLDMAALGVQRITASTGDVEKSTDIFLALNNAILAGGAPMDLQATAMEQFSQSFAKGKPDMMEWRALQSAMPAQLKQIATSMGLANPQILGEKLRKGKIGMAEFTDEIVKLNTKGIGNFASFEKQARTATGGIGTNMVNFQTAIERGMASVIDAIGRENIANGIKSLGEAFSNLFKILVSGIKFVKEHPVLFRNIAIVVTALLVPAMIVLAKTLTMMGIKALAAGAKMATAWLLALGPIGLIIAIVGAVAALIIANWETVKVWLTTFWNWLKGIFSAGVNWVTTQFNNLKTSTMSIFNSIKDAVVGVFTAIWNFIKPAVNLYLDLMIIVWGSIYIVIYEVLKFVFKIIKFIFSGIYNFIKGKVLAVWNFIKAYYTFIWNLTKTVFNKIRNIARTIWNGIYQILRSVVNKILNFFRPAFRWLLDKGRAMINGLINGIKQKSQGPVRQAKSIWQKVKNFFSGAKNWLFNAGSNIINGLIDGIKSKIDEVGKMADKVAQAVRDRMPFSPAKEGPLAGSGYTLFSGQKLVEDFSKGINRGVNNAGSAIDNLLKPISSPSMSDMEYSGAGAQVTNRIGTINIGSEVDGENWLKKLTRDEEITSSGLTSHGL